MGKTTKIWTVVQESGHEGPLPWRFCFRSLDAAKAAIVQEYAEVWEEEDTNWTWDTEGHLTKGLPQDGDELFLVAETELEN